MAKQNSALTSKQKIQIRIALAALGFILVVGLLASIHKTSTNMLKEIGDDNAARVAMMKDCEKQAKDSGRTHQAYTDFWKQCVADGNARLKQAKK